MTNAERRAALNLARQKCLEHAQGADTGPIVDGYEPGGVVRQRHLELASMWAEVAGAMKVDAALEADGPDGTYSGVLKTEYGVITR